MTAVPILLYHAIDDRADPRFATWAVPPAAFAEHMDLLGGLGYTTLTVGDYVARALDGRGPLPARPALVTFDDGFADFHDAALPILSERGMTATVFVATDYVGMTSGWLRRAGEGERPMLTWDQVAALPDAGIECGGHSASHVQLDRVRPAVVAAEVTRCTAALERVLGRVTSFAYPHGYYQRDVQRRVGAAGYQAACAVGDRLFAPPGDRYALPRIIIRRGLDTAQLERVLDGPARRPHGAARRAVWRAARRTVSR
jgi:peptidoglycan/xylan/chitin deacetylase (PgdA/CDA1 family)